MDIKVKVNGTQGIIESPEHRLVMSRPVSNSVRFTLSIKKEEGEKVGAIGTLDFGTPHVLYPRIQVGSVNTVREVFKQLCELGEILTNSGAADLIAKVPCLLKDLM